MILPIATLVVTAIMSLSRDTSLQRRSAHAFLITLSFSNPALNPANSRFHIFVAYTLLGETVPGSLAKST
jgi:hypothetical protein